MKSELAHSELEVMIEEYPGLTVVSRYVLLHSDAQSLEPLSPRYSSEMHSGGISSSPATSTIPKALV